jgi:hypothetical protein
MEYTVLWENGIVKSKRDSKRHFNPNNVCPSVRTFRAVGGEAQRRNAMA